MFNSNILDVAITLGFTYLLLALVVSTACEIINTILKSRSKLLEQALKNLFDNITTKSPDKSETPIFNQISNDAFIKILKGKDEKFPSYIPANNISMAIINLLNPEKINLIKEGTKELDISEIKNLINKNQLLNSQPKVKNLLLTLIDNANGKYENFISGIERTYNDCMERATGWFKRKTQIISFIISLLLVVALNVDSILITKTIWSDKDLLANSVNLATTYINSAKTNASDTIKVETSEESTSESPLVIINSKADSIKATLIKLNEMNLPLGWKREFKNPPDYLFMILGLLITTLAVYLGAPFWFDVLSKFINIRGAGVKPVDTNTEDKGKNKS